MAQEFLAEKQDFGVVKEKIIKTNELLFMFSDKTDKLAKATQAYKNLKLTFETSQKDANRLKLANEQVTEAIERLKPKYEETEKALRELKLDYTKVEEKYHQNLIESQMIIMDLERKVKHCVCEQKLSLSPSTRKTADDKVRELKSMCMNLKELEHKLRIENNALVRKNKVLEAKNLDTNKVNLRKEMAEVKDKLQQAQSTLANQKDLQETIASLKRDHNNEVNQLKMEISRLSLDRARLTMLEKECDSLRKQVLLLTTNPINKSDFSTQTELCEAQNLQLKEDVKAPDKCVACQKFLDDCSEEIEPLKDTDDDFLDMDVSFSDIFKEMILPPTLMSPLRFAGAGSPLVEIDPPITLINEGLAEGILISHNPVPNIIVTPPTPNIDCNSSVAVQFPVLMDVAVMEKMDESTKNEQKMDDCVTTEEFGDNNGSFVSKMEAVAVTTENCVPVIEEMGEIIENDQNMYGCATTEGFGDNSSRSDSRREVTEDFSRESSVIDEFCVGNEIVSNNIAPSTNEEPLFARSAVEDYMFTVNKEDLPESDKFNTRPTDYVADITVTMQDNAPAQKPANCHIISMVNVTRSGISSNRMVSQPVADTLSCPSASETSVSMQKSSTGKMQSQKLPQYRRKFWMPYGFNTFLGPKRRSKQVKSCSSRPPRNDTILEALRLLQQNNINFTISNEPISPVREHTIAKPLAFTEKMSCCNKNCIKSNSFVKLQAESGQEEPELLGFFSGETKKPLFSPSNENQRPAESSDYRLLAEQIISGLKELSMSKRKKPLHHRRNAQNRLSDFNSETEPELERLFRKSPSVLLRNRKLLAAARKQTFGSNGESLIQSDSDLMVDSGLVTATPKHDTDSTSFCSPSEEPPISTSVLANFSKVKQPESRNGSEKTRMSDIALCPIAYIANNLEISQLQVDLGRKKVDITQNSTEVSLDGYKSVFCPAMVSPLASSAKSSPEETIQKTPVNQHSFTGQIRPSFGQKISFEDSRTSSLNAPKWIATTESLGSSSRLGISSESVHIAHSSVKEENLFAQQGDIKLQNNSEITASKVQDLTSEIQTLMSSVTDDSRTKPSIPKYELRSSNKPDASKATEKDLFGHISDSDLEEAQEAPKSVNNKRLKPTNKRPVKKGPNLRAKMLRQVKGLVSAYDNKFCDNSSCASKSLGVNEGVSERGVKKTNFLQDVVVSKGSSVSLEANSEGDVKPSVANKANRSMRKRLKVVEKGRSSTTDVLSEVMQGMTKPQGSRVEVAAKNQRLDGILNEGNCHVEVVVKTNNLEDKSNGDKVADTFWDCPRSPDVPEVPEDRLPRLIPTEKPKRMAPSKAVSLMDKLMAFSKEEKVLDEVITAFAFQDIDYMVRLILETVRKDTEDKADASFAPSPPLTYTQRTLLGFLIKLDKSTHPNVLDRFLSAAERHIYDRRTCQLATVQPITRLYTAVCKMRWDLNRIRKFIGECFYFAGDFAVPVLFVVLTMWAEVLPLHEEASKYPLAKVIVQLCHLKVCNLPGYNLLPLRDLLHKHFGYHNERLSCDEVFKEVLADYIQNPSLRLSDFTVLLYLKNKPPEWRHQKIKENLRPLYDLVPQSNPNLKATLIMLLANVCGSFNKHNESEWSVVCEMDEWFQRLSDVEESSLVQRAIRLARIRLPKLPRKRKRVKEKPATSDVTENNAFPKQEESTNDSVNEKLNCENENSDVVNKDESDSGQAGESVQGHVNVTVINLGDKEANNFKERLIES